MNKTKTSSKNKKIISTTVFAAIIVLFAFSAMCTPVSAADAKDIKEDAITELEAINTTDTHAQKDINKSIGHINKSLEASLWNATTRLDPKHGHKVFDEEKKAVKHLMKVVKRDPTIASNVTAVIANLTKEADEQLANVSINDAKNASASLPPSKKKDKVDKEIAKAEDELAKAEDKLNGGKPDKAIDHYKKAWEHAQHAVKHAQIADFTEGGHLETDFGVNFMAEWWYLNGDARLVASDGEKRDIGFFVVLAHQESPMIADPDYGTQLSHLLTFYGLYSDDSTTIFNYTETYVPQTNVGDYIALGTPYVDYVYPDGLKRFYGSALPGYNLNYISDDIVMDLFFQTNIDKTIDQADEPLNFTTYEHSYGTLHGSILLDGKIYRVTHGEGYIDHMIPITDSGGTWPMDMHGWSWFEVTTKKYQAVVYAVRGLGDGYDDYSYKHLTLLNKHNGKVLAEYSGDNITISEPDWIIETDYNRKRPSVVTFSTSDLNVTVNPETVAYYNQSDPINAMGFVDFMAFQPDGAAIQYNGNIEEGSAFYEYLVTDMGVVYPSG